MQTCGTCGWTTNVASAFAEHSCRRVVDGLRAEVDHRRAQYEQMEKDLHNSNLQVDQARKTAEYWKANHLAGNKEIDELRKAFEATCFKDGGGTHRLCRVCGADAGMSHYPDSPCKILNTTEKRVDPAPKVEYQKFARMAQWRLGVWRLEREDEYGRFCLYNVRDGHSPSFDDAGLHQLGELLRNVVVKL